MHPFLHPSSYLRWTKVTSPKLNRGFGSVSWQTSGDMFNHFANVFLKTNMAFNNAEHQAPRPSSSQRPDGRLLVGFQFRLKGFGLANGPTKVVVRWIHGPMDRSWAVTFCKSSHERSSCAMAHGQSRHQNHHLPVLPAKEKGFEGCLATSLSACSAWTSHQK